MDSLLLVVLAMVFGPTPAGGFSVPISPHHHTVSRTQLQESWGGDYVQEVDLAADLVCAAVRLCQTVQEDLAVAKDDNSLGTTVTQAGPAGDVKVDGTPVTAADFAIQAFVSSQLAEAFPEDRFMGEEDASDLREDRRLMKTSKKMAEELMEVETWEEDGFLAAIDAGVEEPRGKDERVWILDPIDGTKGLVTGKQYIVGLALTIAGKAVVAVMGNPGVAPEVMVAVKGQGLRYWSAGKNGPKCIDIPRESKWNLCSNDFSKLVPEATGWTGWGLDGTEAAKAGRDYPPYLLSRPMYIGSPLPFGPLCPPSEICCGAQVKYFAVARGEFAGFIQFQTSLKSWDHAPGVLCVEESGGIALDAEGNDVVFTGREFEVKKGIVCCAAEADAETRKRLTACVQQTDINV